MPETILQEALEHADPSERATYIKRACDTDETLRAEVESLLAAHLQAGSFMDKPGDSAWECPGIERVGDRVGRYLLREKIAEGGFGAVFRAEQLEPVQRAVALKVIKPGMDSKEVITRFELERQALALMDHSSIAKVYDAGTTEQARPFFVMELVDGEPLTTFCDHQQLDIRERLELFAHICLAIQHAHQKGVIHRDIKPSNILVGVSEDGSPFPKVIDFGVAKAISPELKHGSMCTAQGLMMGTPRYMSPEQAELSAADVDTRSDIYSLGVILYELVTGSAPLRNKAIQSVSFDKVRQLICEHQPEKPSERIHNLNEEERRKAAAARLTEDGKLARQLKGDLDWIVMKALEKDRDRRYDTAQGFAVDVRRYLNGLPVAAGPPGAAYRMEKFVRRNRWRVAVGGLSLLTMLALLVAVVFGYFMMRGKWDARYEADLKRVEDLERGIEKVKTLRADASGSRPQALRILGSVGRHPRDEIVALKGEPWTKALLDQAQNELIACLLWTDMQENPMMSDCGVPWPAAVIGPQGRRYALSRGRGQVEIRMMAPDSVLASRTDLAGELNGPLRFHPSKDRLAAAVGDSAGWNLVIWDFAEDRIVVRGLPGVSDTFDFHPRDEGFVIGTADKRIRFYGNEGGEQGTPLELPEEPVVVRFSPDSRLLAASLKDSGIVVINLETRKQDLVGSGLKAVSLAWDPDGTLIVTGDEDGFVTVLDAQSGEEKFRVREHIGPVDQIAWSHDGLLIASGSRDEVIHLWDSRQGELLCTYSGSSRALRFMHDDSALGPVCPSGSPQALITLDVERSRVCHRTAGHAASTITASTWNPDATFLATAADDGVRLWNREGKQLAYFPDDRVQPGGLACTRGHLYLLEPHGISRRKIGLSRQGLESGPKQPLSDLAGATQIALRPGMGRDLALAHDGDIVLLDRETGAVSRSLQALDTATALAFSPDGTWLASGTLSGPAVRVWNLDAKGAPPQDLPVASGATVAFYPLLLNRTGAPLPPLLLTGDAKLYTQWFLDPVSGRFEPTGRTRPSMMADREGRMAHISYSPRGTALVVSFDRKFLQVLHPTTLELMTQPGFEEQWPLNFSPDGRLLTNEAANGRLFLWNLAELREELKDRGLDWELLPPFPRDTIPILKPGGP